jgi:hypothetical protein
MNSSPELPTRGVQDENNSGWLLLPRSTAACLVRNLAFVRYARDRSAGCYTPRCPSTCESPGLVPGMVWLIATQPRCPSYCETPGLVPGIVRLAATHPGTRPPVNPPALCRGSFGWPLPTPVPDVL